MSARKFRQSWWVDFRWRRVRYRKRSPVNSREGAQAYEATLRWRIARGEEMFLEPDRPKPPERSFADFSREWMDIYVSANNKPTEQATKQQTLTAHLVPYFGRLKLSEIDTRCIDGYKKRKLDAGLSPKTVNNHLAILGKCLRTAADWKLTAGIPAIKLLRFGPVPFDYLSPSESDQLLTFTENEEWRTMIRIALRTGLRKGEILGLRWGDIDFERKLINIERSVVEGRVDTPKTNRIRHVPMTRDVHDVLAQIPHNHGYIFPGPNGGPLPESVMARIVQRACDSVGLRRVTWHALRHSYATQLVTAGVPITVVKELLGHSTIEMTMRYAHLAPSSLQEAVEVLNERGSLAA